MKEVHTLKFFHDEIVEMREGCLECQKKCENSMDDNKWFYLEGRITVANDMLAILKREMEED